MDRFNAYRQAREALARRDQNAVQANGSASTCRSRIRTCGTRASSPRPPSGKAGNRNCLEVGGVWIDEGFDAKMPTVAVKAMSDAYFRMLERKPEMKEVFQLGNHLVWVTPSGTALVIDTSAGSEKLSDEEIDKLFVAKK